MNARFLTESEVAERTQISLATLRRWRLENRGPKYRKFGSLVRYAEDELASWEQNQPGGGDAPDPSNRSSWGEDETCGYLPGLPEASRRRV